MRIPVLSRVWPYISAYAKTILAAADAAAARTLLGVSAVSNPVTPDQGGTGVANNAASTLAISGNFGTTVTVTGATTVTLPTTGTLATLAGAEALTNKTFNGNTWTAGTGTLTLAASKVLTANDNVTLASDGTGTRTLNIAAGGTLGTGAFVAALSTPVSVANGGTGIVTRPAFRATMSTSQTLAAANTPEKLQFDTEDYDIGGYYDPALFRWTPITATAVTVQFTFAVYVNEVGGNNIYLSIYKNGSLLFRIRDLQVNTGPETHQITLQDRANGSTDYYEAWAEDGSATNRQFFNNANLNWFCGAIIP